MQNRILTTLTLSFVILLGALAQETQPFQKKTLTTSSGFTLPYRELQPLRFKESKKYPLVVVLHGAGERGDDNEAQLTHGGKMFADPQVRAKYPAFVVFPQCPKNRVWYYTPVLKGLHPNPEKDVNLEIYAVKELIDQLVATGNIDTRRIYITGLSMGGFGTYGIVSLYPDLFAAAAPICGGAVLGDVPKYGKKLPFWVFHGSADNVVPAQLSRDAVQALTEAGGKVKYTEYEGVAHNSWDNVFADPAYLKWMFKQKRK